MFLLKPGVTSGRTGQSICFWISFDFGSDKEIIKIWLGLLVRKNQNIGNNILTQT